MCEHPGEWRYGTLTSSAVGIVMKEIIQRSIAIIRNLRKDFKISVKDTPGKLEDFVTTADTAVQEMAVKLIRENFPDFGFIGEEAGAFWPSMTGSERNLCITFDPLDGTKAFIRKQSHGIGSMIALIENKRVISAWVGDVNTGEIYGYRPGSPKTHRLITWDHHEPLEIDPELPLSEQYCLLRDLPEAYKSLSVPAMFKSTQPDRPAKYSVFKDAEVTGGSIGIHMARLWKGEVGGTVLRPGHENIWDVAPVVGISEQLGFALLTHHERGGGKLVPFEYDFSQRTWERKRLLYIVHGSRVDELNAWYGHWCNRQGT